MSHFVLLTLVDPNGDIPEDHKADITEEVIAGLLAPYDENTSVPEYEKPCYCVGQEAHKQATKAAEKKCGSMDSLRESFRAETKGQFDGEELFSKKATAAWRKHIAKYLATEKEAFNNDPKKDKPDPECEECKGSGIDTTTYNPKSKWDWWQIGGRWSGFLNPGYDAYEDPANQEECPLCKGTPGFRNDKLGKEHRKENPKYTCNGCDGKGIRPKFAGHFVDTEGNYAPAIKVLDMINSGKDLYPFAIITPNGEWHERAEMGWFGMTSDEKEDDAWHEEVKRILQANPNKVAVVCDCHI